MKRIFLLLALMVATAGLHAQTSVPANLQATWTTNSSTSTGQLGQYVFLNGTTAPRPSTYNLDWSVTGTAPSACNFALEGSSDQVNWYPILSAMPLSCTATGSSFTTSKPVLSLRVNLTSFTRGDTTTVVKFFFNGAGS
jgi:hypothetical protein